MYDEEDEGEYLDDPISLIFNCVDEGAVVDLLTSSDDEAEDPALVPRSSYGNKNFCLPVTFFNIARNVELLKKCKAPSIRLVDCGKNLPKYKDTCNSKQLQSHVITSSDLDKLSLANAPNNDATKDKNLVTKEISNKADKVLVKSEDVNIQKSDNDKKEETSNITKLHSVQEVRDRNIVMPNTKSKKTDAESEKIQALKSKDLSQVDFKRNTGLIGLTISKKDFPQDVVNVAKTTDTKIKKDNVNNVIKDVSETLKTLGTVCIPLPDKNPEPLKIVNSASCSEKPSKEVTRPLRDSKNQIVTKNENSPTYCSLKINSSKLLEKALKLKQAKDHQNKEPSKKNHKGNDKNTVEIIAKDHKNPAKQNKEPSKEKPKKNYKNTVKIIAKDHKNLDENNAKDQAVPKLNLKRKFTETNVFYIVNNASKLQREDTDPNNKTKKPQEPQKTDKAVEIETNEADGTRSNSPILPCTTNLNTSSYTKTMARKKTKKTANAGKKVGPLSYKSYTDNYLKALQALHSIHRYAPNDNVLSKPIMGLNQTQINQVNSSTTSCPVGVKSHLNPHLSSQIGIRVATPSKSANVNQKILQSTNVVTKKDIAVKSRMTSEIAVKEPKADKASLSREGCKRATMQPLPNLQACQNGVVNKNPPLTTILQTSLQTVGSLQKGDKTIVPGERFSKNMMRSTTTPYTAPCPNVTIAPGEGFSKNMMRSIHTPYTPPCQNVTIAPGEGFSKNMMRSIHTPYTPPCQNVTIAPGEGFSKNMVRSTTTPYTAPCPNVTIAPGEGFSKNTMRSTTTPYTPPCQNVTVSKLPVKRLILQAIQETAIHLPKADEPVLPGEDFKRRMLSASSNTHSYANVAVNSNPLPKRPISEAAPECAVNLPKGNEASLPANNNSVPKIPICYYPPVYNAVNFKETPARPLPTSINQNDGCPIETVINHRPQVHRNSDPRLNQVRPLRMVGPCLFPPPTTNIVPPGVQMSHNNPCSLVTLPNEHTFGLTHPMPPSFWRPAMFQKQYFPPDQGQTRWPPQPENAIITATHDKDKIPKESILGSDANGELIKKINIVAVPASKSSPVNNKKLMLEILNQSIEEQIDEVTPTKIEKVINDLKSKIVNVNPTTESNSCKPCPLSKKNITNNLLKPTIAQNVAKEIVEKMPSNGYSPPILPIPTYQQAFEIMARKEKKNIDLKNYKASMKRTLPKQEKAKKISIDEYKKRINGKDDASKNEDSKRKCKTQDVSKKAVVDNSQDLGYDSDSTVILDSNN